MTAADAEAGRGDHDADRGLPEVVPAKIALAIVSGHRRHQGNGYSRPGHVPGPPPDPGEFLQLIPAGDDHEVPRLPVTRGRRTAAGLQYLIKIRGRDGPVLVGTDIPARPDGVPCLHARLPTPGAVRGNRGQPRRRGVPAAGAAGTAAGSRPTTSDCGRRLTFRKLMAQPCAGMRRPGHVEAPMVARDTAWPSGTPCWVDLGVDDIARASAFYAGLFGWEIQAGPPEAGGYVMCLTNGRPVAGIGPKQGPPGTLPAWTTYLAADDADDTAPP